VLGELFCILRRFHCLNFIFSPYLDLNHNVISWIIYFCSQDDHPHNMTSGCEGFNSLHEKSFEQLQDVLDSSKIFIPLSTPRCRYLLYT